MQSLTEILIDYKSDKLTLLDAKHQITLLFDVSGDEIQNKNKYKSAWTYINQSYDGKSTQIGIMDNALRIASGLI